MEKNEKKKIEEAPEIKGKQEKPEDKGKIDDLQLIMKRHDDEGITLVEGIQVPGVGVILLTTKIFKESLGGGSTSNSVFVPKVEIVEDEDGKILFGIGMFRITKKAE